MHIKEGMEGMTADQVSVIQQTVERVLDSKAGRSFDIGAPAHLATLVEAVRSAVTMTAEEALWIVVAMCWLGPWRAGIPPLSMREQLQQLLRQYAEDEHARLMRVMEIVIAYGCGKWRQVQPGSGGWEHRWQGAIRGLVRAAEPAIAQANRWLAAHVVGFPKDRQGVPTGAFSGNLADWSDAWVLGIHLACPEKPLILHADENLTLECSTQGVEFFTTDQDYRLLIPPGAKGVWAIQENPAVIELSQGQTLPLPAHTTIIFIVRDDDVLLKVATEGREHQARLRMGDTAALPGPAMLSLRECTCGTTHCTERHRLAAWDPAQRVQRTEAEGQQAKKEVALTLWDYVASAIKGPQATIKTGAFVQGMYFPLLAQEGVM
jgi:hypothetical protein